MKQTKFDRVHYYPDAGAGSKIFFEADGRVTHGFAGSMAEQELFNASASGAEVIIQEQEPMSFKKSKIRRFHAILAKKGLMDIKEDLLAGYSVESTTELTEQQLDELIARLDGSDTPEPIRKARSSVLNHLGKLGVHGSAEDGWDDVNNYLCNPRIAGKPLYSMTLGELNACARKLRAIREKGGAR